MSKNLKNISANNLVMNLIYSNNMNTIFVYISFRESFIKAIIITHVPIAV